METRNRRGGFHREVHTQYGDAWADQIFEATVRRMVLTSAGQGDQAVGILDSRAGRELGQELRQTTPSARRLLANIEQGRLDHLICSRYRVGPTTVDRPAECPLSPEIQRALDEAQSSVGDLQDVLRDDWLAVEALQQCRTILTQLRMRY